MAQHASTMRTIQGSAGSLGLVLVIACPSPGLSADPLPSWNPAKAKHSILRFAAKITTRKPANR
ncbi:MAG: hypothetical protein VKN17_06570 [Cyanobacteriota bacterium]|nr:hypothetical protein [Cyanobacteriota bacterium]